MPEQAPSLLNLYPEELHSFTLLKKMRSLRALFRQISKALETLNALEFFISMQ
jgi:hypothetical protein